MTHETINRCPLSERPVYTAWVWSSIHGKWLWGGEWRNMHGAAERAERWVEAGVDNNGFNPPRIIIVFTESDLRGVGKSLSAEIVNSWRVLSPTFATMA